MASGAAGDQRAGRSHRRHSSRRHGAIGLSVKAYLACYYCHGGAYKNAAAIHAGAELGDCEVDLLRDAARFVPEIAPLTVLALADEEEAEEAQP